MGSHREQTVDGSSQRQGRRRGRNRGRDAYRLLLLGLVAAAVVKELRTPPERRTWHGVVAGFVPYDLRPPTVARFRERVWAPEDEHLVNPRAFGVGWTLNVGRVVALARQRISATR